MIHGDFHIELNLAQDGSLPSTVQVCPISKNKELVKGRDRRVYLIQGKKVAETTNSAGLDIVLDCAHASYRMGEAPAYGWLTHFRTQNGFIVADVQFTNIGREAVEKRHFRYLSPSFLMSSEVEVAAIHSVALVNLPNLAEMQALNHQKTQTNPNQEETAMPDPNHQQLLEKQIEINTGLLEENCQLRAELAAAKTEGERLQKELETQKIENNVQQCNALLDIAIQSGKIAPAQKNGFAAIKDPAQLQRALETLPVQQNLLDLTRQQAPGSPTGALASPQLNTDQQAAARAYGINDADYAARYIEKKESK